MFLKHLKDSPQITAGDNSILRELLHPDKTDLQIRYSLAHAQIRPGHKTRPHKLKSSEVYYIISGHGLMHIDDQSSQVGPDCAVYIPPDSIQYIENTGTSNLKFLCIVDPAWKQQDEQIF
jgi:mannose-6-phosphate isomerase-like protein (cupin superfamily)